MSSGQTLLSKQDPRSTLTDECVKQAHRNADGEVEVEEELEDPPDDAPMRFRFSWKRLWRFAGPGWLMSLAYLDPGNLESDLQQGAYTNNQLIWVLFWATVMGLVLQEMSSRIGIVTGMDVAEKVRQSYPRWLNYTIYVMMEIAVISADIQEVVGSGIAITLLSNGRIPVWAGCIITGADTFTFLAVQHLGVRYLEALICVLISTMSICFFINWGQSDTQWEGADGLFYGWAVPTAKSYAVTQAVGTVGAVIMPHNLYLHSSLVLSRKVSRDKPHRVNDAIWFSRIESAGALLLSFLVNLALVATNASHYYSEVCAKSDADGAPFACLNEDVYDGMDSHLAGEGTACNTPTGIAGRCAQLGLQLEGHALADSLGPSAKYIWAVGLLAAGQASTMTCTYAGQVIMGGCLQFKLKPWQQVALTRLFALGPALAVAVGTVSHQALFNNINEYLNILQSVQLPFAMLPVLHFSANQAIMGQFHSNGGLLVASVLMAMIVMAINVLLIVQFLENFPAWGVALVCLYGCFYFFCMYSMVADDLRNLSNFMWRKLCCGPAPTTAPLVAISPTINP